MYAISYEERKQALRKVKELAEWVGEIANAEMCIGMYNVLKKSNMLPRALEHIKEEDFNNPAAVQFIWEEIVQQIILIGSE